MFVFFQKYDKNSTRFSFCSGKKEVFSGPESIEQV